MSEEYSDVSWDTIGTLGKSDSNPLSSPALPIIRSPPPPSNNPNSRRNSLYDSKASANNILEGSISSSNAGESSSSSNGKPTLTLFPIVSKSAIQITVTNPQKHGEGSGSYVTYLVTTKTILDSFSSPEQSVKRRFTDFLWLHRQLLEEFPAVIIPPLPGKRRMESYLTGDRFSPVFLERRRGALQIYLGRLARHPTLKNSSLLKRFLEASAIESSSILSDSLEIARQASSSSSGPGVLDNISDSLMNAFVKIKKPDERFVQMRELVDKFEESLKAVAKISNSVGKHQEDLELDMTEFCGCMTTLGIMETQITTPLTEFASIAKDATVILKEKIDHEENQYISALHDYISYCQSVKEVLRLRDQKQVDYEELTAYHAQFSAERTRLLAGRNATGISGFFKERYREMRGVGQDNARQAELARLETKINDLGDASEKAQQISMAFSNEVAREVDFFQSVKIFDFKEILRDHVDSQLEYYHQGFKFWDSLLPTLDNMKAEVAQTET